MVTEDEKDVISEVCREDAAEWAEKSVKINNYETACGADLDRLASPALRRGADSDDEFRKRIHESFVSYLRQQLADVSHERDLLRAAAAGQWREGAPPHPWDSEWFLADVGGAYAVLRPLPEEYSYDFTTADATYFMRHRVKRWAQLSGSQFIQPAEVKS